MRRLKLLAGSSALTVPKYQLRLPIQLRDVALIRQLLTEEKFAALLRRLVWDFPHG